MPGAGEIEVGRKAGVVGEALANGDVLLAVRSEFGHVMSDGVVDTDLALLVELHDGSRGDKVLGERGHVEDGVFGHCFARWLKRAHAVGAMEDDLPAMPDDDDRAGQLIVRNGVVDDGVDWGKGQRRRRRGNSCRRLGDGERRRDQSGG